MTSNLQVCQSPSSEIDIKTLTAHSEKHTVTSKKNAIQVTNEPTVQNLPPAMAGLEPSAQTQTPPIQISSVQHTSPPPQEYACSPHHATEGQHLLSPILNNSTTGHSKTADGNLESFQTMPRTDRVSSSSDDDSELDCPNIAATASVFSNAPSGSAAGHRDRVSPEDENVLKYFILLRPTGPAAKILAKTCMLLYCGDAQSVKEYCLGCLGLSNSQYKKLFTMNERDTLEAGTSWELLDITFLYKLLQNVCGLAPSPDKKWNAPDTQDVNELEHSLYLIKGERNFLAHVAVTLSDSELKDRCLRLKSLLERVLVKTNLKKNFDYMQDVVNMKSKMEEITNSVTSLSLQAYEKELKDLRKDIVNKVVATSQNELFPYYLNIWKSALAWWPIARVSVDAVDNVSSVDKVFTDITIKDSNEDQISFKDLFKYCISDGSLPRLIILEGVAGIGKSHICKYILYKWSSEEGCEINLSGVELIIFVQCQAVSSRSLREFLTEELLPVTCRSLRHEDVIPAISKCNVLFIIDGIDEAGSNARNIIKEVSSKFSESRVLITCRPEFSEEAKQLICQNSKSFNIFYAKGFNESQRREYLHKLLKIVRIKKDNEEMAIDLLYNKMQELEQQLYSLLCLPLTLMMLVMLWLEDDACLSMTTTITRIHQQTIDIRIKQLAQRIQRRSGEFRHVMIIEGICRKWLKVLSKVAWKTQMRNTQILDENCTSELMQEAENYNIYSMDALSSFLKCTTWEKISGTQYVWEFFHKAFQEYLSALHLSCHLEKLDVHVQTVPPPPPPQIGQLNTTLERHTGASSLISISSGSSRPNSTSGSDISSWSSNSRTRKDSKIDVSVRKNKKGWGFIRTIFMHFKGCVPSRKVAQRKRFPLPLTDSIGTESYEGRSNLSIRRGKASTKGLVRASQPHTIINTKDLGKNNDNSSCKNYHQKDEESPYDLMASLKDGKGKDTTFEGRQEESPYDYINPQNEESPCDTISQQQNTLQFLAAMEVSKENVNFQCIKEILQKFNKTVTFSQWHSWATLLRECSEHPMVCQIIPTFLNRKCIHTWDLEPDIEGNLVAIYYLLQKTLFKPSEIILRFTDKRPIPKVLASVFCSITKVSSSTKINLTCRIKNSSSLKLCLDQVEKLDILNLVLDGRLMKEHTNDFMSLMKLLDERDAKFQVKALIEGHEDLTYLAQCCVMTSWPKKMKLRLFVDSVSEEMLAPLCQILNAFSWESTFSFAFTHTQLSHDICGIQRLLTNALHRCSVHIKGIELTVEAYAESSLNLYEDMAFAIASDAPCSVIFENGADGDDVILVFTGLKQSSGIES